MNTLGMVSIDAKASLVGVILLVFAFAFGWLSNYRKAVLAEDARKEDKHVTPIHDKYATKKEVQEVKHDLNDLRRSVEERFEKATQSEVNSRLKIYSKLDEVVEKVGGLEKLESNRQVQEQESRHVMRRLLSELGELKGKLSK